MYSMWPYQSLGNGITIGTSGVTNPIAILAQQDSSLSDMTKNIIIGYAIGAIVHTAHAAYYDGQFSLMQYKEQVRRQAQIIHRSSYEAFWCGFRNSIPIKLIDSLIWPIKVITYGVYLVQNQNKG